MRVTDLLDDLGITYFNAGSKSVRIHCLNPEHDDKDPSLFIDKETGMCHCFPCGFSGNIYTILKHKTDLSKDDIDLIVLKYKHLSTDIKKESLVEDIIDKRTIYENTYVDIELPQHRLIKTHPYLEKRNFTQEEISFWNMGVITESKHNGWIIIPIYQDGVIRTYFARNPFGNDKYYPSIYRSDIIFGLDYAKNLKKKLYIVEGIFDAISFMRTRNQCVAILSNMLLPAQKHLLHKYDEIVLIPDNDVWGNKLLYSAQSLLNYTKVSVCKLPAHRHDTADCTLQELLQATYLEVPLLDYLFNKRLIL